MNARERKLAQPRPKMKYESREVLPILEYRLPELVCPRAGAPFGITTVKGVAKVKIEARLLRLAFARPSEWDHLDAPSRLPPQLST